MENRLKWYEIWVGNYSIDQGLHPPLKPKMVGIVKAPRFNVACMIFELERTLESINGMISDGKYVDDQSCRWFYDYDKNENSWTGKYFETEEEAWNSFKNK